MGGNERSVSRLDYKSEEDDIELVNNPKPVMEPENIADKTVTDEAATVTSNNDELDDLAEPQLVNKRAESTSELIPPSTASSSATSSKRESLSNSHSFEHQSSNHLVMTKFLSFFYNLGHLEFKNRGGLIEPTFLFIQEIDMLM